MLTSERRALLLSRLAAEGRLVGADLARELRLSEDTVRRDLRDLAAEGRLTRVHGGALPAAPTHLPLAHRETIETAAKARLGRIGATLIRPGMIVILDGGTTHQALVAALPRDLSATIVTHSPTIAAALAPCEGIRTILLGGTIFRHSMVALGGMAEEGLSRVQADLCLIGVTGLHPDAGLTTGDHEEALFKSRMMTRAAETALLVTPDKIGTASPWRIAGLGDLATLVTIGPGPDWLPGSTRHISA